MTKLGGEGEWRGILYMNHSLKPWKLPVFWKTRSFFYEKPDVSDKTNFSQVFIMSEDIAENNDLISLRWFSQTLSVAGKTVSQLGESIGSFHIYRIPVEDYRYIPLLYWKQYLLKIQHCSAKGSTWRSQTFQNFSKIEQCIPEKVFCPSIMIQLRSCQ